MVAVHCPQSAVGGGRCYTRGSVQGAALCSHRLLCPPAALLRMHTPFGPGTLGPYHWCCTRFGGPGAINTPSIRHQEGLSMPSFPSLLQIAWTLMNARAEHAHVQTPPDPAQALGQGMHGRSMALS